MLHVSHFARCDTLELDVKTLGIREVRQRYEVLKETLEKEGEVILTHHGKPFARVLPLTGLTQQQLREQRGKELAAFRATQRKQAVPSEVLVREDRDSRG
jgi:antitoxin (DNA-binding transcriptional repressor) of toxin-antitoxin stability system